MPNRIHSWHLFSIRLNTQRFDIDRDAIIDELKRAGVGTSVHWMPLHMHPYYQETQHCSPEDCPCAAAVFPQLVSLPIYPDMTTDDVEYVCRNLVEIIARSRVTVPGLSFHQPIVSFAVRP